MTEEIEKPQHFWLTTGEVITRLPNNAGFSRMPLNTLLKTDQQIITRVSIATAQQAMLVRFHATAEQVKGAEIVDVVLSFSYLGLMTQTEFHAGLPVSAAQEEPIENKELN